MLGGLASAGLFLNQERELHGKGIKFAAYSNAVR